MAAGHSPLSTVPGVTGGGHQEIIHSCGTCQSKLPGKEPGAKHSAISRVIGAGGHRQGAKGSGLLQDLCGCVPRGPPLAEASFSLQLFKMQTLPELEVEAETEAQRRGENCPKSQYHMSLSSRAGTRGPRPQPRALATAS